MNLFKFDYDLTFAVLMMGPDGRTHARYGSQDHRSSADRMSIPGLKKAMRAVLASYQAPALPASAPAAKPFLVNDYAAFQRSTRAKEACYHCHYANDARFGQMLAEGTFKKDALFQYPLPENIGVALDVDANTLVKEVLSGSAAEKAGLQAGDILVQAEGTPVYTPADLQFVLDPLPDPGRVTLQVERGGKRLPPVKLDLPRGWRKTDISWRPSQGGIPPQIGFWGRPLRPDEKQGRGLRPEQLAIQVNFFFPGAEWAKTRGGMQNNDLIVGVNGEALPEMTTRQFHSYFRLRFQEGDTATLNVLRGGQRVELQIPCMAVKGG